MDTATHEWRINPTNAREMALRSWDARRKRKAEALASITNPAPPVASDVYVQEQLIITRAHLERLDKRLATASDALDIDRLARARASLAEQERILAGRPLPGKAKEEKPARSKAAPLLPG